MKLPPACLIRSLLGGLVALPAAAVAQQYLVDLRTYRSDGTGLADRIFATGFLDAPDVKAPLGTSIWIVADTLNDGIPLAAAAPDRGQGHDITPDQLLGPDDLLVRADAVDGTLAGGQTGRYSRGGIVFPPEARTGNQTASIWVIAWSQPGVTDTVAVVPGLGLDFVGLGQQAIPPVGNPVVNVTQDLLADRITVVPEPVTPLLLGAGCLALRGSLRRQRLRI